MHQVILVPDEETGGYSVQVPSLPDCWSEGDTIEESIANIKAAIAQHIDVLRESGDEIPEDHLNSMMAVV
ncbi:MAG: type II toxin-antitoxin system HicB family antitoxin [Chloroflexota bacterium]